MKTPVDLTRRDWFVGQAMASMDFRALADRVHDDESAAAYVAHYAIKIADLVIESLDAERSKA